MISDSAGAVARAGAVGPAARRREGKWRRTRPLMKPSIYIPQKKTGEKPVERLIELGQRRDRSVNYLVVEAILEYVQREETRN